MYSPAAVLSIYYPNEEILSDRKDDFINELGLFYNQEIFFNNEVLNAIEVETKASRDQWHFDISPRKLFKIRICLYVVYKGGKHENVCLEDCRNFINKLIDKRVIDTVSYSKGLPRNTPFVTLYKPSQYIGYRPYVMLEAICFKNFSNIELIVDKANVIIENNWNELIEDETINMVELNEINQFLDKNKSVKYWSGLLDD